MKFDIESVLKNAVTLVSAQMNTEIGLINTAKGDSLSVPNIPADAYFFASIPKAAFNYKDFVVYGFLANPTIIGAQEDNNIKTIQLFFEVVSVDAGENFDQNVIYKLLRYSAALESIFLKNSSKLMEGCGKVSVETLVPSSLFSVDGKMIRSAGVSVTARITAR